MVPKDWSDCGSFLKYDSEVWHMNWLAFSVEHLEAIGGLLIGLIISMCCVSETRQALKEGRDRVSIVVYYSLLHENISRSYRNPPDKL